MKIDMFNKKITTVIIALAFFNFIFLGAEYLFDNMMTYVTNAEGVVLAESYILGASFFGFLLFPVIDSKVKKRNGDIVSFIGALIGIICIFSIWQHGSYISMVVCGCVLFVVLGFFGSSVHYKISMIITDKKHLASYIGIAYALGILLQFICNNFVTNDIIETSLVAVSLAVLVVLLIQLEDELPIKKENVIESKDEGRNSEYEIKNPLVAVVTLTGMVVFMSCIFSTLNISVTYVHAEGGMDIGQWPRLFLGISGLTAGFVYDMKERKYMNFIMYCITILSVISVVITETCGPFLIGLIVFYLSAGFFVVFFTTAFIELSYQLKCPRLWAGFGRAVNNVCAVLTSGLSIWLLSGGRMLVVLVALVLFVLISICLLIHSKQFEICHDRYEMSDEVKFSRFCEAFSITEREREVLGALLVSDENVQDIATNLSMSRAVLYRYIASLNSKTNTKSRIGLLQFYYAWKDK